MREVKRFNKWGVEADYVVIEYVRKVNCLRLPDKVGKKARTRRLNKGSKHATDDNGEGGTGKKRQRTGGS